MDLDQLKQILDLVREHDLSEFEIEHDGLRLKVRKDAAARSGRHPLPAPPRRRPPPSRQPPGTPAPAAPSRLRRQRRRAADADGRRNRARRRQVADRRHVLPLVRSPGAASFVEIGATVKKGQVLCIIEAMKLMNEIDSEYDGEVVEHLRRERPAGAVRRAAVRRSEG